MRQKRNRFRAVFATNGIGAMGRLFLLSGLHLVLAGVVAAQQPVHRYSVAGDVERPQTYQFGAGDAVGVTDLLRTAGIIESGNALVLRGSAGRGASATIAGPAGWRCRFPENGIW